MPRLDWLLAVLLLMLGTAVAQGENAEDHQGDHDPTHDHDTMHEHDAMATAVQGRNVFDLGDNTFAIFPLLALGEDGYHGSLVLTLAAAAGSDEAMTGTGGHDANEMHDDHASDAADDDHDNQANHEGGEGSEGEATPETPDVAEDHADHQGDMEQQAASLSELPRPTAALLTPNGTDVPLAALEPRTMGTVSAYQIPWFSGATVDDIGGVWRLTLDHAGSEVVVPIAIATENTALSDVVTVLAPAPSLSSAGLTEVFVYAFRQGEPVHAAIDLQRRMPGMQHSTDDDQVPLVHDHFVPLAELLPVGEAMANRTPLNFAMAGSWELLVRITGENAETIPMTVQVLSD